MYDTGMHSIYLSKSTARTLLLDHDEKNNLNCMQPSTF